MSSMNPKIASAWVEKNRKTVCRKGARSLKFSPASPIDFAQVAHKIALQVAKGTADMDLFERNFWPRYFDMLSNRESHGNLLIIDDGGDLTAIIIEDLSDGRTAAGI